MEIDNLNTQRSNIKYLLFSLFSTLEKRKEVQVFTNEQFTIYYDERKGMLLKGRNPDIKVDHAGVSLPEEYTDIFQIPYEWIKSLTK